MATPIPYLVKKGDSLSKIAGELGIDNWRNLRTYHNNNNCQPISEQIGEQLKEGKTLLTPSKDEIDKMNGKSQEIIEEKQNEEKEIAAHEDDKEEEKQKEAEKGEHDNKYFVVHGAKCSCDQSEVPKKLADLQVTSHSKVVYNDEQGKYAATEDDKTFLPVAVTFGNCKLKPNGSGGYLPCSVAPAPKWDKPYDKTKILGKKVLTEISQLKCLTGGIIKIEKHGQTDSVLTQHAENTNALELAMVNPASKIPPKKSESPNVTHIVAKKIENHSDFKEIASNEEKSVEKIIARPHEEITFEAKLKSGNKKLVSWLVYGGHEGKNEQRLFLREQIGCEFKNSFEPGKYRVEGYGQPKEGKSDKNYPSASFDLEITHNRLDGSALLPTSGDFAIGSVGKHKLRKGFPASFDPKFLMTPTEEESDRLKMYVLDEAGNMASPFAVIMNQLTFTPKNSDAKYNFIAEFTDAEGNVSIQNYEAETIPNSVLGVKHETETVRPYTNMNFSVTKTKFSVLVKSDADLTIPELTDIKWSFNGKIMGQGRTFSLPGTMLSEAGEYTVKAQALSSLGFGKSSKNEFDEWHFKVAENKVTEIKITKKPKAGTSGKFQIGKMLFSDYIKAEDRAIEWKITGPVPGNYSGEEMNHKFSQTGDYVIFCNMGGRPCEKPIAIKVVRAKIFPDTSKWIDRDNGSGNVIKKAGYGQTVCAYVKFEGLDGEHVKFEVFDDDSTGDNLVYESEGILKQNSLGVYWPVLLSEDIRTAVKKHGITNAGDLYFRLTPIDQELEVENGNENLGANLEVTQDAVFINAYFTNSDDTQKIYTSSIAAKLYLKLYAANMVGKKAEINFITNLGLYSWIAWNAMKLNDWEDIKEKFDEENWFYSKDETFNENGEILIPVEVSKLGKLKNFTKINAAVKISIDEDGKAKEKGTYLAQSELVTLYATASLPNLVENKSAVMVERARFDNDKKKEEEKCPRCGILTLVELDQIFTNATKEKKEQLMSVFNQANSKFGLNTCQQKAHFFAQVREEVGTSIDIKDGEGLNYAVEKLTEHFTRFSTTGLLNGPPNDLAFSYGRIDSRNISF